MLPFTNVERSKSNPQSYNMACIKKTFYIWDFSHSTTQKLCWGLIINNQQKKINNHLLCDFNLARWMLIYLMIWREGRRQQQKHYITKFMLCIHDGKGRPQSKTHFFSLLIFMPIIHINNKKITSIISMGG